MLERWFFVHYDHGTVIGIRHCGNQICQHREEPDVHFSFFSFFPSFSLVGVPYHYLVSFFFFRLELKSKKYQCRRKRSHISGCKPKTKDLIFDKFSSENQ